MGNPGQVPVMQADRSHKQFHLNPAVSRSTLYRKLRTYGLEKFVPSNTSSSAIPKTKRTTAASPAAQESGYSIV